MHRDRFLSGTIYCSPVYKKSSRLGEDKGRNEQRPEKYPYFIRNGEDFRNGS